MRERFPSISKEQEINKKEHEKSLEKISDGELETIIEDSTYVNAGNNGIILRVDLDHFPEFKNLFEDDSTHKAIKLLKVYRPGEGEHEFQIQNKAYELVENAPNKDELAKIPAPLLFRDIPLSEKTISRLKKQGAKIEAEAELLLMDYVEGQDLATTFYSWIIEHANPDEILPVNQSFSELHTTVAQILGYQMPGGRAVREGDQAYKERKAQMENADKLYTTLKKSGFKPPTGLADKIKKTFELLHKNGIFHNDPHERNFMTDKDGNAYIIDFGSAGEEPHEDRVSDDYILNRLEEFEEKKEKQTDALGGLLKRFSKNKDWARQYADFVASLPGSLSDIGSQLLRAAANEHKFELVITMLYGAYLEKKIPLNMLNETMCSTLNDKRLPTWASNRIKKILDELKND